jgi:tetratricopeptide (TPR) repeat protein
MIHVEPPPNPSTELGTPPPARSGRRPKPRIRAAHGRAWARPSPFVAAVAPWRSRALAGPFHPLSWTAVCRSFTYLLALAFILGSSGCRKAPSLPAPSSTEYKKVVAAFYVGLAALQVGDDARADTNFAAVTRLAATEPAGWANWGVLALRQRNFHLAAQRLGRARDLAPQDGHIYNLLGMLESNRGRSASAIANFRKATELNPEDLRNTYALAQEFERQGEPNNGAEFQQSIEKILALDRDNLAAQLELSRIAAKRGETAALQSAIAHINAAASAWPPEVQEQLRALRSAADQPDLRSAALRTTLLRNVLWRVPEFRRSFSRLKASPGEELQPYTHFVRLVSPVFKPAPPDAAIRFDVQPLAQANDNRWNWIGAIQLASAGAPTVAWANAKEFHLASGVTLPFPSGSSGAPPSPEGILQLDFNYDFKTDIVLAGEGGVRFFRQESASQFTDVTNQTKLPTMVLDGRYTGAWAADIEADGDLDVVLGSRDGIPVVLRNNGDGGFIPIYPFSGISGLRQFAWADLDGDGTPDAVIVDGAGRLHVFINERQGQFRERAVPAGLGIVKGIAIVDAHHDGPLAIIVVQADGALIRISDKNEGESWDIAEIARVPDAGEYLAPEVRLHADDLDNNGAIDLYLAPVAATGKTGYGALIWLGDEKGQFTLLGAPVGPDLVFDAADLDGDGKLALLGLSRDGQALRAQNRSAKNYHWQIVRPHAARTFGDQRINPFGVGGAVEIRSGLLLQKRPITGPQVHFGLGEQPGADVIRVLWPNGVASAEFEAKADQETQAEQRLKGSCPFLFAYNGRQMEFVKDAVPWGSAIGLRINTLGSARIAATEEWFKIGRDQLAPHDGFYDLRFTAELWEVYYYDYLALMTVDHPAGTEIFVDERFAIPPVKLAISAVETPHPIARAYDDRGQDVTDIVRTVDGRAVDSFGLGQYQGVTRDHYLEVELGEAAPRTGPLYLIAHGSIYPTDSSINVALSEGDRWRAKGLSLEVPDGRGGWIVARDKLGFPAGRKKTVLIDLTNVFRPGTPRRLRLRTNLEIYWDAIEWARGLPKTPLKTALLRPTTADLHYRGYSVINRAPSGRVELPDYAHLAGTKQRWRDLTGYYTRYGDVRELLAQVDDRYVIMNAGDELALQFPESPPPSAGWVRDFVIVGDGWIKDGDYNSTFSKTVLPLPRHSERNYTARPAKLEDEWTYRHHPEDWQKYHTRYITPDVFNNALSRRGEE